MSMKGLIVGLAACFALSACSSLKLEDIAGPTTAAGVTAGSVVLTVHPAAAIVAGAAAGAAVEAAIEDEVVDITQVENEHQADVAKKQIEAMWWMDFIHWIIGAVVVLTIVAWVLPGPQNFFRRKNHAQSSDTYQQPTRGRRYQRHPRS